MARVHIMTLRVMGPDDATDEQNAAVVEGLSSAYDDAVQMINDEIPEGYYCKIEEA